MKRSRVGGLLFGATLVGLLAWLALRPLPGHDPQRVEREFEAMGTLVSISVHTAADQPRAAAEAAMDRVEQQWQRYTQDWSAWGDGALGQINAQLSENKAVAIPPALQPLFTRAAQLYRRSEGRFDVRVGHLVEVWGFHDILALPTQPPPPALLQAALAALRQAPLIDEPAAHYGPAAGIRFDFGAIAKGDAVDRAIAQLRADGFPHAIVNAGGNLRAAGRPGRRAWRIGIRHPRPSASQRLLAMLETDTDEAVVTSGDYERYFEFQNRRYHHLLDPDTGQPATALQSVTVVTRADTALADAASTALFIAGTQWPAVARAMQLDQVLVVDANGRIEVTPKLAARLMYPNDAAPDVHILTP